MNRIAKALLLPLLAVGSACPQTLERRRGLTPEGVHGRPVVPIIIERHPLDPDALNARLPVTPPRPDPAPTRPTPPTTCDAGGCWDGNGLRYNGRGPTTMRSDGKVCQQIGTMMHCN